MPPRTRQELRAERPRGSQGFPIPQCIDWEHPENNVYHFTEELEVSGRETTRRPDLASLSGILSSAFEGDARLARD